MNIRKVNLADPRVEPTDEELEALSRAALALAIERRQGAVVRFREGMSTALAERVGKVEATDIVLDV